MNGNKKNTLNKVVLETLEVLPSETALSAVLSLLRNADASEKLNNGDKLDVPVSKTIISGVLILV